MGAGKKMYYMTSSKWSTWAVALQATALGSLSRFGLFSVNLDHPMAPYEPRGIAVHLCSVSKRGFSDYVMIQSPGVLATLDVSVSAYVHTGSWFVYGSVSEPGTGGYWLPSESIAGLDPCE